MTKGGQRDGFHGNSGVKKGEERMELSPKGQLGEAPLTWIVAAPSGRNNQRPNWSADRWLDFTLRIVPEGVAGSRRVVGGTAVVEQAAEGAATARTKKSLLHGILLSGVIGYSGRTALT